MRKTSPSARSRPIICVRRKPGSRQQAIVSVGGLTLEAAIGRSGRTAFKREGDGATPIAAMKLISGFWRPDRVRGLSTALPMRPIRSNMLWCDASGHPAYNRPVKAPFKQSHEELSRRDDLYDICIVLDWNIRSRRRDRGSAIFFHLSRPGYEPTAGCVALQLRDMRRLLPFLRKGSVLRVF